MDAARQAIYSIIGCRITKRCRFFLHFGAGIGSGIRHATEYFDYNDEDANEKVAINFE